MYKAQAVTNGVGNILSVPSVMDVSINGKRKDPWRSEMLNCTGRTLASLLNDNDFSLLARHIMNERDFISFSDCQVGKNGTIRSIKINGEEYRSSSYRIYHRNVTEDELT